MAAVKVSDEIVAIFLKSDKPKCVHCIDHDMLSFNCTRSEKKLIVACQFHTFLFMFLSVMNGLKCLEMEKRCFIHKWSLFS